MNTMQRAHEIRKAAADKWICEPSEIIFAECLKMAHRNEELESMKGSEKQVRWALDIKKDRSKEWIKGLDEHEAKGKAQFDDMGGLDNLHDDKKEHVSKVLMAIASMRKKIAAEDSAGWWIDHRFVSYAFVLQEIHVEMFGEK